MIFKELVLFNFKKRENGGMIHFFKDLIRGNHLEQKSSPTTHFEEHVNLNFN